MRFVPAPAHRVAATTRGAAMPAPVLRWCVSLVLLLPVIALYACEYSRVDAGGRTFTGFLQYDQPYYMADARKFFDGGFHLLYGNPFSPDPHTPRIYFQIHLLVLGFIRAVTGCDPGTLFVIFGFFAALACVRVAAALYEQVAGLGTRAQWAGLVLFIWGGGILALTGLGFHLLRGDNLQTTVRDLFHFDPAEGWWFLNLGRNLIFPMEAYYHALALGAVLMVIRSNFRAALWLTFLLSLSHPFTGLQFLLILLAWCGWEKGVLGNGGVPFAFPALLGCILLFHLVYNLVLLNLFPEHRALFAQWSIAWLDPASAFVPGDLLVGFFACRALWNARLAGRLLSSPANRLLLTWFVVSFALAHHDWLITPRQPLHFSRGYAWIPLFLLGAQPLLAFLERCFEVRNLVLRVAAVGTVFLVGLSDNLAWFGLHAGMALAPRWGITWLDEDGFRLNASDRQLYAWLTTRPEPHPELLVAPDRSSSVIYLAMTYTDYRSWYSHYNTTPFAAQRRHEVIDFFADGTAPPGWRGRTLFVILPTNGMSQESSRSPAPPSVYENQGYVVRILRIP